MKISASLVLYKNKNLQYETCIASFFAAAPNGVIYVADNSPVALTSKWFSDSRVIYTHMQRNLGFGAAHNHFIKSHIEKSDLHLILNPDIKFSSDVLINLSNLFENDSTLSAVMPKVIYPDGSLQRLCKLLPTPVDLIVRRFIPFKSLREKLNERYELYVLPMDEPTEVQNLSGCFLLIRTKDLIAVNGFDERFFMYLEDVDLVRRLSMNGKTLYVPSVTVEHEYAKGSYKSPKLLYFHISSAILYFNKWGWFFDSYRNSRNKKLLSFISKRRLKDVKNE